MTPVCLKEGVVEHCFLTACKQFLVETLELTQDYPASTEEVSFHMLCVTDGAMTLLSNNPIQPELKLGLGDVVLIPAAVKDYQIAPDQHCKVLRCRIPDLQKDVSGYLTARGVPMGSIVGLGGDAGKNDY